ncbi:MAG TPA: ferredoxin-thioredoxin reductase catalytic domain-containing protein [Thermodesulfobacteriota bacterium]|nr:ferredoxin-thioredoxin reductase catalytic domain-containing protein [Thermodesulfobacteriota bacterium]
MSEEKEIAPEEVDALHRRLHEEAESGGYHLNPDASFTKDLVRGLIVNTRRYGYQACPCRLSSGNKSEDLDIICPCDYRDPDVVEHGACYCALYVSQGILEGKRKLGPVPERRPPEEERAQKKPEPRTGGVASLPYPVWRCKVCGYLCAREGPPEICPVCKAKKDRFERFM